MGAVGAVRLREVVPDDLPTLYAYQLDPEATRMAAFPPRNADDFTAHWTRILADPTVIARAILADRELAGNVGSWDHEGRRLLGYWLGRDHWGKGVATRALAQFLEVETARPVYAHVAVHNVGSIRVLEKCGFTAIDRVVGDDGVEELVMCLAEQPPG